MSVEALKKNPNWKGRRGPVVLVIMDGVGYGKFEEGDAVRASKMKYLDWFTANCPQFLVYLSILKSPFFYSTRYSKNATRICSQLTLFTGFIVILIFITLAD